MKGDYYRYIAEYASGETRTKSADAAHNAYKDATAIATTDLVVTDPIRLGLALNFSVFYYEVLENRDEACKMANQAFEDAMGEVDNITDNSYKDR
jgi:14-3-3 protein epsilon